MLSTILENFHDARPLLYCVAVMEIIWFISAILKYRKTTWNLFYLMIMLYPFLWYFMAANHSYLHSWFAYREMAISVYAFAVWIVAVFSGSRKTEGWENR
ncbi:MAG: hypothetical protein NC121_05695 [Blautia sp.]|nr:hypothetical protein [Blautia sp.]